jgi:hypothetical protein
MKGQTAAAPQAGPGFVRRNGWVLAIAALLAVIATVFGMTWAGQQWALDRQKSAIDTLQERLKAAQLKNSERVSQDVLKSLGVSQGRLGEDAPIITSLVETAFTWDSGTAYEQARTKLKDTYGLSEKDAFLKDFMPPSRYNEDSTGKRYYYIDAEGLNSSVDGSPDIQVVKVVADDYTYLVLVDVGVTTDSVKQNGSRPGAVTADRRMLLFVTVDAAGDVSGFSGVPANGATRHSR